MRKKLAEVVEKALPVLNERKFWAARALHKLRRAQVHAISAATVRQFDVAIDEYSGAVSVGALDNFSGECGQGSGGELFFTQLNQAQPLCERLVEALKKDARAQLRCMGKRIDRRQ